jgi:hypothetical protein
MSFISKDIDLQKSKEQSPSNYPDGVIFKKRIRTLRSNCTWSKSQEFRVNVNNTQNVRDLTDSYKVNGMLYDEPVQVVEVDPNNKDRFLGVAGHHRDESQGELNWDYAIYDVVEFETPQDRIAFGAISNQHIPKSGLTKEDLVKVIAMAVGDGSKGCLTNDDTSIREFISRIAKNKTSSQQDGIFKKYRSTKSKYESMRPLDGKAANELAKELGIPFEGDKNLSDSGEYGYVKEPGGYKSVMHDGLKTWVKEDQDIVVTGYITHPKPAKLYKSRKTWKQGIDNMNDFLYEVAAKLTNLKKDDVKKLGLSPFKYGGFLPQVVTNDPTQNGLPKENDIVDVSGKPIE